MATEATRHTNNKPARPSKRLARERRTLTALLRVYCRGRHGSLGGLCESCAELQEYALARLDCCPFAADKPVCARCTVHCYRPAMRERIREVMRYAGPRLLLYHPILALRHQIDGWKSSRLRPPAE